MPKKTTSSSKKVVHRTKVGIRAKKAAKKTVARLPQVTLTDNTVLVRLKSDRNKKGPKQKILELVPYKGGVTLRKLVAEAKKADLPYKKVPAWAKMFCNYSHLQARA